MELILKDEAYKIVGCCMEVYNTLGSHFLESVYQEALALEFRAAGVPFEKERQLDVVYKGKTLEKKFFADFVCYERIIVETKAVASLLPEHQSQVLNYLSATNFPLGILVNFGSHEDLQWKRIVL